MIVRRKSQGIKVFGTLTAMAKYLGISKSYLSEWDETLTWRQSNEVSGAVMRYKKRKKK